MDVTLGPLAVEKSVAEVQRKPLTDAMGDAAWNTVKNSGGCTPKKLPEGKPAGLGFTISGTLTSVVKSGRSTEVVAKFIILVDGSLSNVTTLDGRGSAHGSSTAEDALRTITERRVKTLLGAIKAGRVAKLR